MHYETEAAQKKLSNVTENGSTNSKQFWNSVRSIKKNNTEDMYAITTEIVRRFLWINFLNEYSLNFLGEYNIKEQTATCYQKLYTPIIIPVFNHSWTNFIEQQITTFGENKQYEKEYCNREITI